MYSSTGYVSVCAVFGAVNLLARHVPGALFMGFYKEKCYFCLVYRKMEGGRERNEEREGERHEEKGRGEGEVESMRKRGTETRQTACHTQLKLT